MQLGPHALGSVSSTHALPQARRSEGQVNPQAAVGPLPVQVAAVAFAGSGHTVHLVPHVAGLVESTQFGAMVAPSPPQLWVVPGQVTVHMGVTPLQVTTSGMPG